MPQVARDVVKARAARFARKAPSGSRCASTAMSAQTAMALVEAGNRARLPDFAPVRIDGVSPEPGRPALFNLVSRTATELVGVPA